MEIQRHHETKWGKNTYIQIADRNTNAIVVRKLSAPRKMRDDSTTWWGTQILILESHCTPEEAALMPEAIMAAIKEAEYMEEQWPEGSEVV